jgi:hypothetical protein
MTEWRDEIDQAIGAFETVADLAGDPIDRSGMVIEFLDAPHLPPARLPAGMMAIYGFWHDGRWLKIGKAGPRSNARYTTHHYGFNAPSTLAKSLRDDPAMGNVPAFDPGFPGSWIKANCCRINILLPATRNIELLNLLEAFLHLRLRPIYEGFASQRIVTST